MPSLRVLVSVALAALALFAVDYVVLRRWIWFLLRKKLVMRIAKLTREGELQQFLLTAPKRIILIRHGESEGNQDRRRYCDVPDHKIELTKLGFEQAVQAGQKLRGLIGEDETVTFYVSPYKRCRQTYEGIARSFKEDKIVMREDPRLREQEWGYSDNLEEYEAWEQERNRVGRFFYRFPNGESGADVFDRVTGVLESIFRRIANSENDNIVIISHGLLMRLFLMRFYWFTVEQWESIWNFNNCEICLLELEDSGKYVLKTPLRTDEPFSDFVAVHKQKNVPLSRTASIANADPASLEHH